jgi:hypothetical protein
MANLLGFISSPYSLIFNNIWKVMFEGSLNNRWYLRSKNLIFGFICAKLAHDWAYLPRTLGSAVNVCKLEPATLRKFTNLAQFSTKQITWDELLHPICSLAQTFGRAFSPGGQCPLPSTSIENICQWRLGMLHFRCCSQAILSGSIIKRFCQ